MENAVWFVIRFLVLIPAIVLHEVSHGYAAYRLGDPTAKMLGRLTLNPLKHVDPFGTIILPILLLLLPGGFVFGYAKPVPFNPRYFHDVRMGRLITGVAGPAANLALALVCALFLRLGVFLGVDATAFGAIILSILDFSVLINLMLLFFNLLPIPPLDGSHVVQRFLPAQLRQQYLGLGRFGMIILFGILYLAPQAIFAYFTFTLYPVYTLFTGLAPF